MADSNQDSQGALPQSILIIDDDSSFLHSLEKQLKDEGIPEVHLAASVESGWKSLELRPYELVILDWKLPDGSGAALLNRCRQTPQLQNTPILVVSGFLSRMDYALVEEFPFTGLVEKPFNRFFLMRKIRDLKQMSEWFARSESQLEKIIESLDQPETLDLTQLKKLIAEAPTPVPLVIHAARRLRASFHFGEAKEILSELMTAHPDCVLAITEMGKILLHHKQFREAAQLLEKANGVSAKNVERLCLLGNANLQMLQHETAQRNFEDAAQIDSKNKTAKAGVTLCENFAEYFCRTDLTRIPDSFAGLLNAIGISLVRTENYTKGIEHYKAALEHVDNDASKTKLAFNTGLGFLRWHKPEYAVGWFAKAALWSSGTFDRAQHYLMTITSKMLNEGKPIAEECRQALAAYQGKPENPAAGEPELPLSEVQEADFSTPEAATIKPSSDTVIADLEIFIKTFPEAKILLSEYKKRGSDIEFHIRKLMRLTELYEASILNMCVKDALRAGIADSVTIEAMLTRFPAKQ